MMRFVHRQIAADPSLIGEKYANRTLLHFAAAAGSLRTVELLLRHGADPNVLDGGKHTPLYSVGNECASAESADVVHALVLSGARIDAADGVTAATPLHMAARRGNAVVARALLNAAPTGACGIAAAIRHSIARSIARSPTSPNCCASGSRNRDRNCITRARLQRACRGKGRLTDGQVEVSARTQQGAFGLRSDGAATARKRSAGVFPRPEIISDRTSLWDRACESGACRGDVAR